METSTVTKLPFINDRQVLSGLCCVCGKKTSRLVRADGRGGVVNGWNVSELIETYGGLKITAGCMCVSCRGCVLAIHARVLKFRALCAKSPLSKSRGADSGKVSGSTSELVKLDDRTDTKLMQLGTSATITSSTSNVPVHFLKIDNKAVTNLVQKQKYLSKYRSLAPKPAEKESHMPVENIKSPWEEMGQSKRDHTPDESRSSYVAGSKLGRSLSERYKKDTSSAPDMPVQLVKIDNPAVAQYLEKEWVFIPLCNSTLSGQEVTGAKPKPVRISQSRSSLLSRDASWGRSQAEGCEGDEQQTLQVGESEAHNDHTYNTPIKSCEEIMLQYVKAWSRNKSSRKGNRLNSEYINTLVSRTVEGSISILAKTIMGIQPLREEIITCLMGELNNAVCMLSGRRVNGVSCLRPVGLSETSTINWDVVIREMDNFMPEMLQLCLAILHNPDTQEANMDKLFQEYKPRIGMVYSVLLQGRIKELSRVQRIIGTMLRNCGFVTKVIFNKLQPMGVCLSYSASLSWFKQLAQNKEAVKEEDDATNPSITSDTEAEKPKSSKVDSKAAKVGKPGKAAKAAKAAPPRQTGDKRKLSHPSKSDSPKKKRVSAAPVPSSTFQEMANLLPVAEQSDPLLVAVSHILNEMSDL